MKYVLKERLPFKWNNEACWVYLKGLFCLTEEEEEASKLKPIKRCFIGRFKEFLEAYMDHALGQAELMPQEMGLRWILMFKIDLHLGDNDKAKAKVLMERLRDDQDKIRRNYW